MSILSNFQPAVSRKTSELLRRLPGFRRPSIGMPDLSFILGRVLDVCLHLAVFLVPLIFSTLTIDTLEIGKQTLLIILTGVAATAWLGKALTDKQLTITRSWLHLSVAVFVLGYLVISLFSDDKYLSFTGSIGQGVFSFATVAALGVIYLIMVNRVSSTGQVYDYLVTFLASSLLVSVFAFFQLMGWFIFKNPVLAVKSFTSVGSIISYAVWSAVPIVIAAALAVHGCRNRECLLTSEKRLGIMSRAVLWATLALGVINLILINYWVAWTVLIFGTLISIGLGLWRERTLGKPIKLVAPLILVLLAVIFMLFKGGLPRVELPTEVSPSTTSSWNIALDTLQSSPLVGSGPGTWIYDYAKFRAVEINGSPFWNARFDRGISFFMTLLATTGIIGVILWILLIVSAIVKSWRHLTGEKDGDLWYAYLTVFSGFMTAVLAALLYNANMAHALAFWFLLALLGGLVSREKIIWRAESSTAISGALSVSFVVVLVASLSLAWLSGQRYVADAVFAGSVKDFRAGTNMDRVIAKISRAISLNPLLDVYPRNLSQAHLIKASQIAQAGLTPERGAAFNQELAEAQKSALRATEVVAANVDNWANLALVYQNLAGFIPGADEKSIAAFQEAAKLEPNNPVFPSEIGKMYFLRSDVYRKELGKDRTKDPEIQANIAANLKQAQEWLSRSVTLKPDYLPSRYFRGVVYERQGNLQNAIAELESAVTLNNKDVGIGFELAILYHRNSQKDAALDLLKQIIELDPSNANALWYLAAMYEERGEKSLAIVELEKLAAAYPDNEAVKQRLSTLKSIPTKVKELPEPLEQEVTSPAQENPLRNP